MQFLVPYRKPTKKKYCQTPSDKKSRVISLGFQKHFVAPLR